MDERAAVRDVARVFMDKYLGPNLAALVAQYLPKPFLGRLTLAYRRKLKDQLGCEWVMASELGQIDFPLDVVLSPCQRLMWHRSPQSMFGVLTSLSGDPAVTFEGRVTALLYVAEWNASVMFGRYNTGGDLFEYRVSVLTQGPKPGTKEFAPLPIRATTESMTPPSTGGQWRLLPRPDVWPLSFFINTLIAFCAGQLYAATVRSNPAPDRVDICRFRGNPDLDGGRWEFVTGIPIRPRNWVDENPIDPDFMSFMTVPRDDDLLAVTLIGKDRDDVRLPSCRVPTVFERAMLGNPTTGFWLHVCFWSPLRSAWIAQHSVHLTSKDDVLWWRLSTRPDRTRSNTLVHTHWDATVNELCQFTID
jgi:hypothetical protein